MAQGKSWWKSLSAGQKRAYLAAHPNSKFGKAAKKAKKLNKRLNKMQSAWDKKRASRSGKLSFE